jgi:hypothetical protein
MLFDLSFFSCVYKSLVIELVEICGTAAAVGLAEPFAFDGVDFPVFGEDFVNGDSVKLEHEIAETHPPGAIGFFCLGGILDILFDSFVLFPVIGFFAERSGPDAFTSPGISEPDQPQIIFGKISHVNDGVVMIFENALLALFGVLKVLLGRGRVDAGNEELLLVIIVQEVPHVAMVDFGHGHVLFHLKLV